jgi:predicted MPP superfamily phosphohydrolase
LRDFWRKISKTNTEFIIHLGDFLNKSNPKEYEYLKKQLRKTNLPIYFVAGNHDIRGESAIKAFQEFTGKPLYYYFDYENARFIILNNAFVKSGEEQINWLIEVLKSAKGKYKFVFWHQPLITLYFLLFFHKENPFESKRLIKIFEEEKLNYIFRRSYSYVL